MKNASLVIILSIVLIGFVSFTIAEQYQNENAPIYIAVNDNGSGGGNESGGPIACPMDAIACPDGSYITRNASNDCRFNECPGGGIGYENQTPIEYSNGSDNWSYPPHWNENMTNESEPLMGASCGTVTPGYQNQCCISRGYAGWDSTNFTCIGEGNESSEGGYGMGAPMMLGAFAGMGREEWNGTGICQEWNCTRWSECTNETQTRDCVKIADCPNLTNEEMNETPKTTKDCHEKEKIEQHNNSFECPEECDCTGSTITCTLASGRTITVYTENPGSVVVQIQGINSSTNVTLYEADGKIYGIFKGNETKPIHLPDEIKDKLENETRTAWYNESINLTDDGYYKIQGERLARLFWLIPVREHSLAQIDAQTGETIKIRNPWWGFLARDIRTENNATTDEGTNSTNETNSS